MENQEFAKPTTLALLASSAALIAPLALSYSTTPTPQHPQVLAWYLSLKKPSFKPKDWLIPLAWFGIEASLARATYRLVQSPSTAGKNRSLGLLAWNILMIGGWSRLFFGRRNLPVSTIVAASMIVTGTAFVTEARHIDPPAARAGVPFVVWVSFATVLTGALWAMNRHRSS